MLRVEYVYRLPAGGLRLRSHNSAEYQDEVYRRRCSQDQDTWLGLLVVNSSCVVSNIMIIKNKGIVTLSIFSACLLTACGGGSSASNTAPNAPVDVFMPGQAACHDEGAPSSSSLSVSAPQSPNTTQSFPLLANVTLMSASKTITMIDGTNSYSTCQSPTSYGSGLGGSDFFMGVRQNAVYDGTDVIARTDDLGFFPYASATSTVRQTEYFEQNGNPLGYIPNGSHCLVTSSSPYPTSVSVGDSGTLSSLTCYTDTAYTNIQGYLTETYSVLPYSAANVSIQSVSADYTSTYLISFTNPVDVKITSALTYNGKVLQYVITDYLLDQSSMALLDENAYDSVSISGTTYTYDFTGFSVASK